MKRLCLVLLCALTVMPVRAQYASDFKCTQLLAPVLLTGAGLGLHYLGHEAIEMPLRDYVQQDIRQGGTTPFYDIGSYVQYVPSSMHIGLGLLGARSQHAFLDRTIESSIAHLTGLALSRIPKLIFNAQRPDGGSKAFPSGHSILAFAGAELTRMDYGAGWGAGAYALAAFVGVDRIYGDRHWIGDILAGAGLGVLSAHVGGWLLQPVKNLFGIPDIGWDGFGRRKTELSFVPVADPVTNTYRASVLLQF